MNNENNSEYNLSQSKPIIKNQFSSKKNNGIAIFSLVLGIISIAVFWAPIYPIITGIAGLVMGIIGIASTHQKTGLSVAGLVTSIIGTIIGLIMTIIYFLVLI